MKSHFIFKTRLAAICLILAACGSDEKDHDHEHNGHDDHEHETVTAGIDISMLSEFDIEYDTIVPSLFYDVIKTSGTIRTSDADAVTISAKKNGIIFFANDINQGINVKAGEKIATISVDGLQGGDVNQAAKANLEAARAEYDRLKPLHEEGLVTTSVFREAERAYNEAKAIAGNKNSAALSVISSPTTGTLISLLVKNGDYVETGAPVAIVAKNSQLMLTADLPTREAAHIADLESANFFPEGHSELVRLKDLNGKKISGNSTSNAVNGYIPVTFSFTGNPLSIPAGYAEVFLLCKERNGVISVPRKALLEIQGNKYVYVNEGEHGIEKRLVHTGASDGERVEITDGLTSGEVIVSKGASVVRMAELSAVTPPAHSHNH